MPGVEIGRPLLLAVAAALALLALRRYPAGGYYSPLRRRVLTALRLAALVALLPAAGRLALSAGPGPEQLIVVEDRSASVSAAGAAARDAFVAGLRRRFPDRAPTLVRFAATPSVVPAEGTESGPAPVPSRTNLAAALETAAGLGVRGRRPVLVLLSDGEENEGSALAALPALARSGVRVLAFDLSSSAAAPPSIQRLAAPQRVIPGELFTVTVGVRSGAAGTVRVRLLPEGAAAETRTVEFDTGAEREVSFAQRARRAETMRYRVRLEAPDGRTLPAGERILEVPVAEPFAVTVLTDSPRESRAFTGLLAQAGMRVSVQEPQLWRASPDPPGDPGVIVLDNLPAPAVGVEGMEKLERLVRERGAGLLVFGGMLSLGAGDYADTPLARVLPVTMDAPPRGADAELSLVIVLDASLSMFFRGRGQEVFAGSAPRKMELAKAAILEIAGSLRRGDKLGLLESKDELRWVHELGPIADREDFDARLGAVRAYGGGINFYSSVREAAAVLRPDAAPIRHVMVLADADDIDQLEVERIGRSEELVREMARERITLSIFALGNPSDKDIAFLRSMALLGRGDFYLVSDVLSLPRYFRSEYRKQTGEQIREEEFLPLVRSAGPGLRGLDLDRLPAVEGLNLVSVRTGAEELLVAPYGAPLLAQWRYGRGRSAVFASDSGERWAGGWYRWEEAERFWKQLLYDLAPRPAPPAVELRAERRPGGVGLTLRRLDGRTVPAVAGSVRLQGAGAATEAGLQRLGLHRFEAALPPGASGSQALSVGGSLLAGDGEARALLDEPPPDELAAPGRGRPLLEALAQGTGGALVRGPEDVAGQLAPPPPPRQAPLFWLLAAALVALFGELLIRY